MSIFIFGLLKTNSDLNRSIGLNLFIDALYHILQHKTTKDSIETTLFHLDLIQYNNIHVKIINMARTVSFLKSKKWYLILGIFVLLFIIVMVILLRPAQTDSVYTLKRENLQTSVLANATYTISSQTSISSPTNGIITGLYVDNNQNVKKGNPLFNVESTATDKEKKAAYAAYLADKSTLDADTAELYTLQSTMYAAWKKFTDLAENSTYQNSDGSPKSINRVLPEFTTAQDDWLAAEANYKNQQSVLAKDQAALSSSLQTYNETQSVTVNAPISGSVTNLLVKNGDQISSLATSPVLVIANLENPYLYASLNEVNIPKIKIGQLAEIVFDALPDQKFTGTVTGIDTVGTKIQGSVTYNIRISADKLSPDVKPNMTASVTIIIADKSNILTVPNNAITTNDEKTYVEKANHGNKLIEVKLGLRGLTKSEVTYGLSAGDQIVVPQ